MTAKLISPVSPMPENASFLHGSCLCGAVAFELTGPRPKLYQCHCSLCRKQGGSASNTATIVADRDFRWLRGVGEITSYVRATGFRSDFCRHCGSPVPNPLRAMPCVWIPAGLLDGDPALSIAAHLHLASKAAWDTPGSAAQDFDTMPDLADLVALLHP